MAKLRGVDARLSRLRTLRYETAAVVDHIAELRDSLDDKSNLVVADAAQIVGERGLADLVPEMVAAFERFMEDPAESDKQCRALIAIVTALNKLEYDKEDVFLSGIHHVQPGNSWGDDDAAAPLRGHSAFGLVRINYPGVVLLLADLLADPARAARAAAVQALGATGSAAAPPLLRYKARSGDKDPAVTAECLTTLMHAFPKESLAFVAGFLRSPSEAIQEGAAFALAESRRADALDALTQHWPQARHGTLQEVILLAISTTRLPGAIDFLLEVLASDRQAATPALAALAIHRHNDAVKERIAAIVAKKGDAALLERFQKKFEAKE